ncbi:MAG: hypothetical protein ACPLXL_02210 [Minisyncoccia bacterium]
MKKAKIFRAVPFILSLFVLCLFITSESFADLTIPTPIPPTSTVWDLIEGLLKVAFNLAIPLSVGVVIYAGYLYITSAGNEKKVQQAHKTLIWGLIGFAAILIAKSVPKIIENFLKS